MTHLNLTDWFEQYKDLVSDSTAGKEGNDKLSDPGSVGGRDQGEGGNPEGGDIDNREEGRGGRQRGRSNGG